MIFTLIDYRLILVCFIHSQLVSSQTNFLLVTFEHTMYQFSFKSNKKDFFLVFAAIRETASTYDNFNDRNKCFTPITPMNQNVKIGLFFQIWRALKRLIQLLKFPKSTIGDTMSIVKIGFN